MSDIDILSKICPNCGANMKCNNFVHICNCCGTKIVDSSYSTNNPQDFDLDDPQRQYDYIQNNKSYISSSRFVSMESDANSYRLFPNSVFFSNDGKYNKVTDFSLSFNFYVFEKISRLHLLVNTNEHCDFPHLSVLLDYEDVISFKFEKWENQIAWFSLSQAELLFLCNSDQIEISSNLWNSSDFHFEEFIHYSRRFYHTCFDKRKFNYSIYINLITD